MHVPLYIRQLGIHCCHVPSRSVGKCCLHVLCIKQPSVVVQATHQGPTRMKTHAVKRIQPPGVEDKGDVAPLQPKQVISPCHGIPISHMPAAQGA